MAGSGPGGGGNCRVYGEEGHQYHIRDGDYLKCDCGDKVFKPVPEKH